MPTTLYFCVCFNQGRGRLGAIYTFAAGNGGLFSDSCAYNGYVNSIYTIAINGLNEDGSTPTYAEDCPGIMATAYSRDTLKGLGKVVSKQFCFNGFSVLLSSSLVLSSLQKTRSRTTSFQFLLDFTKPSTLRV